ncbi:MAG: TlpA family protein disulfide reductase [Hyphomicrobiales bacterium]|nr:TlpA family protein disulfide reductase [Hyphomicrobiales bacterium]
MRNRALIFAMAAMLAVFFVHSNALAQASPRKAPQWDISEWMNSSGLQLDQLRGKVVVIDFFQMWCPGCKKFSIPLMNHWENQVFTKELVSGKLVFVSIHTVFEGHGYQTPKRLRRFIKEKGITHPVGVDRHIAGRRIPETMRRYNTGGTPEMAFIDKQGNIRFQKFGFFEPSYGETLIRTMLDETVKAEPARATTLQ